MFGILKTGKGEQMMDGIKKERLDLDGVASDMRSVIKNRVRNFWVWRLKFILPSVMLLSLLIPLTAEFGTSVGHAVIIAVLWITLAYSIIMLGVQLMSTVKAKRRISRGLTRDDVSVTVEKLSHITTEEIYEPYISRHTGFFKTVIMYYFSSGLGWREPVRRLHYEWSELYQTSGKGLENSSIAGDEFYVITLKADRNVRYIYNTKLFGTVF